MSLRVISDEHLGRWLGAIVRSGRRLVAPRAAGPLVFYQEVLEPEPIELAAGKPAFSLKGLLFPITEPVLRYRWENGGVALDEIDPGEARDTVVAGVRPCDAAALGVLDQVFLGDDPDPFYARRREKLTVIGLSCAAVEPECFCTAVGLSPASSAGCDLFLTRRAAAGGTDGTYLLQTLTPAGHALIEDVKGTWKAPRNAAEAERLLAERAAAEDEGRRALAGKAPLGNAAPQLRNDFESPVWEEIARKCLGCGICAFVCPTCHCFDLVEEGDVRDGCRCRTWDSCCFAQFTLHASGHNPRPTQMERYRQRVMHKFAYFVETTGRNMCVGCGRCTRFCPVGMDLHAIRRRWP